MPSTRASARAFALLLCLSLLLTSAPAALQAQQPATAEPAASDNPDAGYSISGKVATAANVGVAGVSVTATFVGKPRIILLPGVMGTELVNDTPCAGRPSGKLWIDITSADKLEPLYLNDAGNGPRDSCDVISPDGPVQWPVSPYAYFTSEANKDFQVLTYPGYDWRLNLNSQADALDAWIKDNATGPAPIYLVAHSMGGLVARAYVATQARADKIAGVVTVGTPYLGAPIMAKRMVEGKSGTPLDSRLVPKQVQSLIRYSPGIMQLLPSAASFTGTTLPYYRKSDGSNLSTYAATVAHIIAEGRTLQGIFDQATAFHATLDGFDKYFYAAEKYTVLYSIDSFTPSIFREKRRGTSSAMDIDNYVMGDATVPGASASLKRLPVSSRSGVVFCSYDAAVLSYKVHGFLFDDSRIVADVLHILKGEPAEHCDRAGTAASSVAAPAGFREISVWGEGRVQVFDAQGSFTGVDDDGIIQENLPDVTYMLSEGGVIITFPSNASYELRIIQTGEQPLQIIGADFGLVEGETYAVQAQSVFDRVAIAAGGSLTLPNVGASLADLRVQVDANADGTPEQTLPPDAVLTDPVQAQDVIMPISTITLAGIQDAQGRYTGTVTVTVTASDNIGGSGLLASYTSLDDGQTWQKHSAAVLVPDGSATSVHVYSSDKAGNQEYPPKKKAIDFASAPDKVYLPTISGPNPQIAAASAIEPAPLPMGPQPAAFAEQSVPVVPAAPPVTVITNALGNYTFTNLPAGVWTVTAAKAGYTITPAKLKVTLPPDAAINTNFTAIADMRLIPAGPFQMGCESSEDPLCNYHGAGESPLHTVTLDAFTIDTYEVTNARYARCVASGGCTAPHSTQAYSSVRGNYEYYGVAQYANFPVIQVDWFQASAYCAWVGKRLPSEAEWEKAARGSTNSRIYPWGNATPDCTRLNYYDGTKNCVGETTEVGSYESGASPYGVMDMSGNVWEWVNDWWQFDYYSVSPPANPQGPATGSWRMVRSGSFGEPSAGVRSAVRGHGGPETWGASVGFRCARSQ